ncbi:MAG: amino acid permease [Phycisphaerales bacterium]
MGAQTRETPAPARDSGGPVVGARRAGGLGTFAGVFTPSILTILGIILFQRLGYVVGAGGLARTLGIIAIATAISLLTSFSLAAIATNMRVKGGGDYYLISRTLGIHYGGAIGLVLFLAQSVSVAFYCIGFGEALAGIIGFRGDTSVIAGIAAGATLLLGAVAFLGADLATKFQYIIMAALALALGSLFVGGIQLARVDALIAAMPSPAPEHAAPFWTLFAIFFPAVTGFTQGVSMSGDLKDPARSLPRGTLWAVGISTIVYVAAAVLLAASLPLATLASDLDSMRRVAASAWLIEVGVIAATLSSALASFLGAPRILQSLARDNVMPPLRRFAAGSGASDNPRAGVLLAGAVALATIALGSLDTVASVVGMCFLLSYGLINYATFIEARTGSPSFRPRFRFFNAWASIGGAALCLGAGVMISPVAAAVAGALMVALHQYLRRAAPSAPWADSRYAYHFRRVRDHLIEMRDGSRHPRDWRPHVLALCNDPTDRTRLLTFASWIDGDSGFTTAVRILTPEEVQDPGRLAAAEETLREQIREAELGTFARVVAAPSIQQGLAMLIQAHGLGSLRANTLLMSAEEQLGEGVRLGDAPHPEVLDAALRQGQNLILLRAGTQAWTRTDRAPGPERVIDVWWRPGATSRLCLLLAHLVTRSAGWHDAKIRVRVLAGGPADQAEALAVARAELEEARIDADACAVEYSGPDEIVKHSAEAALVFFPLRVRGRRLVGPRGLPLEEALEALPVTALVVAGEDIDLDAQPDDAPALAADGARADAGQETRTSA